MHLKKVSLSNFRCFKQLELNLHPQLTVLVAENGGGKTAILDAIAIGLSSVLRYLSTADQRVSGLGIEDTDFRVEKWGTFGEFEHWGASDYTQVAVETVNPALSWDNWRASVKGKQPEHKSGQKELASYVSSILASLKTSEPKPLPVFAYYGANRGWIDIPERLRASKMDYTQPTTALVGALDSLSDFKEMLKWFDSEEAAELRASHRLLWDAESDMLQRRSTLSVVRSAISSVLGETYHSPHFNAKHKFVIYSNLGPNELQVSQLSQGYQSMLALTMDFARRLAIANSHLPKNNGSGVHDLLSAPAIMLVDEIDLHLHPSWQQRVLADLMRTFPCTQFIVTSHSPQVLSTVPSESIRIIKNGAIYASPPGTDGAEAQRVLEDVFHVPSRPKTAMSDALNEYLRLVDARQWESERALELRRMLDEWSQGNEPSLLEADLQIENMKWESGQ